MDDAFVSMGGGVGGLMTFVVDSKHKLVMFGVACKQHVFRWMELRNVVKSKTRHA